MSGGACFRFHLSVGDVIRCRGATTSVTLPLDDHRVPEEKYVGLHSFTPLYRLDISIIIHRSTFGT